MSTRHIAAESARLADLTPQGSSRQASKRFRQRLAADGFTVDDGFKLKPGYLYTVVRAISARVNQNYDGWPSEELKKSYKTFIGKPVFVNHENHDPTKARGVVVAARYVENGMDKYIEVVQEIDAQRFPKLAHEIKTGGLDSVSMGAEAGFTICSYCQNKATDLHDMCDHVRNHKGKTLSKFDKRTGSKEDILVFESCHKISFFELSYVFEPADETAVASKVVVAGKQVRIDDHDDDEPYRMPDDLKKLLGDEIRKKHEEAQERLRERRRSGDPAGETNAAPSDDDPSSFFYHDPDLPDDYCDDCGGELGEHGISMPVKDITGDVLCKDCLMDRGTAEHEGWDPDDEQDPFDPRIIGAGKVAAWGETAHGDMSNSMGDGHSLHVYSPHLAPAVKEQHPIIPGDVIVPEGGNRSHEWVHTHRGEPINGGNASSREEAIRAAEQSHKDLAGGFDPDKQQDPFDPRLIGASRKTANDDVTIPAPPGTTSVPQEVIDNTPVYSLPPATELTGHEAPGLKQSGKYTKEDFAAAGNRKPWESDDEDEDTIDAAEITAMIGSSRRSAIVNPLLAMPVLPARPRLKRTASADMIPGFIEQPGARPIDFSKPVFVHTNRHAVNAIRKGEPREDVWSIKQEDPETGIHVRGYAPAVHLVDNRFSVQQAGAQKFKDTQNPDGTGGQRVVHAGVYGYIAPPPDEPQDYSLTDYHPGFHTTFVHRDNGEPVHTADRVHFTPDVRMYSSQADNWGRDHRPTLIFEPHPTVNAANLDTVGGEPHDRPPVWQERTAVLKKTARARAMKLAWGEVEAPMSVDTLREEGSAPEDDDDDFEMYVTPPKDLQTPDLSQAAQVDRQQEQAGASADQMGGVPGAADPAAGAVPQQPQQQFMTLQIPMPSEAPQVPQQAAPPVAVPPEQPMQMSASTLDYFDRYYGHRVANWMDAIEARRDMTPAEAADYRRQTEKLSTLENGRELSTTDRNPTKGTADMARSTIASRSKVARAGRRQHFAEGPLVDGGDRSRNDQGEQEEAFISQTPPLEAGDYPTDDTPNISNTEHNLVARVQQGRAQLLRDAQALASLRQQREAGNHEWGGENGVVNPVNPFSGEAETDTGIGAIRINDAYANPGVPRHSAGIRRAFDEAGGPTATVVDPAVNAGPGAEELTGDGFVSADPNDGVVPTNPKDASLRAFQAFDSWLSAKTGKSSRNHTEANIKKAAAAFSREAGISPQALFPALGIVLREARKNDKQANTKGAKMRKRSNESLDVAAPDGRIDVETPVADTTDAAAQASQFDLHDFGNNAGDNVAKPDLSTDQNWAPGEASGKKAAIKTAGGLLAMRCAEGMIAAGLEPNSRERKYQLAAEFENMNRGLIQDRVALLERFAAVREADLRKVASGNSRGAARSPIPAGLGGGTRTAAAGPRLAAHDPSNDSSLFI